MVIMDGEERMMENSRTGRERNGGEQVYVLF